MAITIDKSIFLIITMTPCFFVPCGEFTSTRSGIRSLDHLRPLHHSPGKLPNAVKSHLISTSRGNINRSRRGVTDLLLVRSSSRDGGRGESMDDDAVPPNCSRYKVKLQKPLGLVLEETSEGIRVAEIQPGGNAERLGIISPRDQLIATSGFIRTTQQVYGETTVQGGEQMIRLNVRGESWETVMAAISSHLAGMEVELEFQKCSDEESS